MSQCLTILCYRNTKLHSFIAYTQNYEILIYMCVYIYTHTYMREHAQHTHKPMHMYEYVMEVREICRGY